MRRRVSIALSVCLAVMLVSGARVAAAQDKTGQAAKKEAAPKTTEDRVDGTVKSIDKATKTVTVQVRGKTIPQQVMYSDTTKFTFRNKPATIDEMKENRRVIVLGKKNDKNVLIATRIDIRDEG